MNLNGNVKHILRYGTAADQTHLEDMINTYDILAINGNMVAFMPGAIATFLVSNFINKPNKGYFIDPLTHAFQHNIDFLKSKKTKKNPNPTIKSSIRKMIEQYDEPVLSIISSENVVIPEDFDDEKIKHTFCENVLKFQLNTVTTQLKEKKMLQYLDYGGFTLDAIFPEFLIAPYFYLTTNTFDEWCPLNIEMIEKSSAIIEELCEGKPLFAELVISKDVLIDSSQLKEIINQYGNCSASGIAIWIDDFNEQEIGIELLRNYIKLVKDLSNKGKIVYNLYGGFFSIMLTSSNLNCKDFILNGVGHGLEYGESRPVVPVGGGLPTSKYYFYPLHQRLDFNTSYNLLSYLNIIYPTKPQGGNYKEYEHKICNCPTCLEVLDGNMNNFIKFESTEIYTINYKNGPQRRKKASKETKEYCLKHYLYSKNKEFTKVFSLEKKQMVKKLLETYDIYKKSRKLSLEELSYLKNWAKVLDEQC